MVSVVYAVILAGRGDGISVADLMLVVTALTFVISCLVSAIPAALVIWLSEKFAIRSILFFAITGGAIGALGERIVFGVFGRAPSSAMVLFAVAGLVAGAAYWWIAGKHAGMSRQAPGALP